jgi:hypothetical protein
VDDSNFDMKGVQQVISEVLPVYRFLGVPENVKVFYPQGGHDFPVDMRTHAYAVIDSVLHHTPDTSLN